MKVLHALVGYLTVTAQPFYPFAFAHPLAARIDDDGYVKTTQNHIDGALIKPVQVLGSIVETCQTITTQNHSDSGALMNRVPGDIIEARQPLFNPIGVIADVEVAIVFAIVGLVLVFLNQFEDDDKKRENFTQDTVSKTFVKYPTFSWVICHSPHSVAFDGVEGTDWGHTHHELGISFFRTIGYDLYWVTTGNFYRYGDGGYLNWAFNGKIIETDDNGATLKFGKIS